MEDDSAWVFDSLICFLNGPVWNAPLQSFIEEKSLIFEPNVSENDEYMKIFDEFKNLVDFMLGNFMEDMGISPQQFEEACNRENSDGIPIHFDQNLFELIWAANDYNMFKRMMTQRNVELQLQALELIEHKYGITPQSFVPNKYQEKETVGTAAETPKIQTVPPTMEEEVMEEVIKKFPSEAKASSSNNIEQEVQYLLEEKNILENTLKTIEKEKVAKPLMPAKVIEEAPKTEIKLDVATTAPIIRVDQTVDKDKEVKSKKTEPKPLNAEIDKIELKKRQDYLRAQRDKLVALKKEVRKKHLTTETAIPGENQNRPKSAKAAENLLSGNETIKPQQLQLRKTLIERLKSEVIENKDES